MAVPASASIAARSYRPSGLKAPVPPLLMEREGVRPPTHRPHSGRPHPTPSTAAIFSAVFQLRPVPRVPSRFSMIVFVSFERPIPSG